MKHPKETIRATEKRVKAWLTGEQPHFQLDLFRGIAHTDAIVLFADTRSIKQPTNLAWYTIQSWRGHFN